MKRYVSLAGALMLGTAVSAQEQQIDFLKKQLQTGTTAIASQPK